MKIVVVGAGRIGSNLARVLSEENHEVYVLEQNETVAQKINEKLDAKVICGNGADPEALKRAGIEGADLVIAVTLSDETNLTVCLLAAHFGAKRKIARVRNVALREEIQRNPQHFHIDELISPDHLTAQAIVRAIETPGTREVGDFANGRILMRSFEVPRKSPLCGAALSELRDEDFPWPFLIVMIMRGSDVIFPKGDTAIQANDRIYVLLPKDSLAEFLAFLDPETKKPGKVIIYGATRAGERVAQALSRHIKEVIVLEENVKKADLIADKLKNVRVINGSASEKDILIECGIEAADVFAAVSENDNSNLISAVLAKKMGAKNTICLTQQPDYLAIVDALDVDVIINPHMLAVEQILGLVRGRIVGNVTKLLMCGVEASEMIPEKNALITRAPLKDIVLPKNAIVGAVLRAQDVFLAQGNTQLREHDSVVMFYREDVRVKIQKMFQVN